MLVERGNGRGDKTLGTSLHSDPKLRSIPIYFFVEMWLLLLLTAPFLAIAADLSVQECFDEAVTKYITCKPVHGRPAVCDCTFRDSCYIKMIISKRKIPGANGSHYLINQTFQGPTITVEQYGIVVIDFSNEMDEDTSFHFHGMHQRNVPWIDGVGNVTQYPIPAKGRFRYIFRADPQGTHWYHAHMRYQRSKGLFGALIVREAQSDIREKLGSFEDQPERKTLLIVDQDANIKQPGKVVQSFCLPDGSNLPVHFRRFSLLIYGKEPATSLLESAGNESHTQFYVVSGKNYRFRIIDGALGTVFVISIDHHKLYVIATDGYLVKPFETDFLIVHVGETYDFILKAKRDILPGSKYPMRIQSLAVNCKNNSELAGQGFVFLVYTNKSNQMRSPTPENLIVQNDRCNNKSNPCAILNCPFKIMPNNYSKPGTYMKCYDILSLELLYPTPSFEIPRSADVASEFFFNLEGAKPRASIINGIKFRPPEVPILESEGANECKYPVNCTDPGIKHCPHTVHLTKFNTATRFVLSVMNQGLVGGRNITHPIHMHGHTYFIAKIQYPEYYENGTMKAGNNDLQGSACAPAKWRNGTPEGISVTSTTVRKDTVMVPAGGYVVLHFFQDNPGYWFMHCHVDWHLNDGMAIALVVNPERASTPPNVLNKDTKNFCFSVNTFLSKETQYPGNKRKVFGPNPAKLWNLENYEVIKESAENYEELARST